MKGYIDNYEDLQVWVESTKQPLWNLYSGWVEKFGQQHLLAKNEEELDPEQSFNQLRRMIEINSPQGGHFTVYIPQPSNRGFSTRIKIAGAAGVAGVGGFAGVGNPYALGMIPMDQHEKAIRKEKEMWELQHQVEALREQQEAGVGVVSKLVDKITSELDINNVFNALVAVFGPKLNPNMQPMQLSGTPVGEQDHSDGSGYTYDDPRLLPFLDTIRCKFSTDEEFYTFLGRVGAFFDKNPQMAMTFFAGQTNG